MKQLYYKSYGEGPPLVILHGLFGMSDNWRTFANELADQFQVILPDLRNHGRSFQKEEINYPLMAEDVKSLMDHEGWDRVHLMGHSMGGKVAMEFAHSFPERVDHLIIVDIAPKTYPSGHDEIFKALRSLPIDQIQSRSEAQDHLAQHISQKGIQLFLMKNLKRHASEGYEWKMNLDSLYRHYSDILAGIQIDPPYFGPCLFIGGAKSRYIQDGDHELIFDAFKNARIEMIPNAGHWVHAEQPEALLELVRGFLS